MRALVTVTYPPDYGWLRHATKSIERYLTGFDRWFLWVPLPVDAGVSRLVGEYRGKIPLEVKWFPEWPGRGFCHHEWIIVGSDKLHDRKFQTFTTWDADMILTRPADAQEFFGAGGKPILPVRDIGPWAEPRLRRWHQAVKDAIGIYPETDGMGWLPLTYFRDTLHKAQELIQAHTGKTAEEYIRSCKNDFPQTFAEFNTLSYVAWRFHKDRYDFRQGMDPWGQRTICHFWSHGGLDTPLECYERPPSRRYTDVWTVNGKSYHYPREILADLGFL